MIVNNEHKLCRAFGRLFKKQKHIKTTSMYTIYTARVNDTCLPHHPCPDGGLELGTYYSRGERSTTDWAKCPLKGWYNDSILNGT